MPTLVALKSDLARTISNLRGWRTSRKLVVFESDDWGAIRMPGRRAYDTLLKVGIRVDKSLYDRLDCLESRDDLEALLNVLDTHRDSRGRPAVFTFNTVMGNPDFEAIRRDGFERFYHQSLFDSYREYHGQDLEPLWRNAMAAGLIRPQFHAREHLNTPLWMRDLRDGHAETRAAFEQRFYGLKTRTGSKYQKNYLATYWPDSPTHMVEINEILADGLSMFQRAFGYCTNTFIACNYVWPQATEQQLADQGVKVVQTQRGQIEPDPDRHGATRVRRHYTGQTNSRGLHYSVRNVLFEPYLDESQDWVETCIREVRQAFRLGKPAIICTHRINYSSSMDVAHRDRNLGFLARLLAQLCSKWPDIEFTTSDGLFEVLNT